MDAASGLCEGCLRSIDEIAAWGQLDDAARREIVALLPGRCRAAGDRALHQCAAMHPDRGNPQTCEP
jgi:predicted Fe-S protein YdhL (DUF1289 family)